MDRQRLDFYILEQYDALLDSEGTYGIPACNIAAVFTRPASYPDRPDICSVILKGVDHPIGFDPQAGDGEQLLKDYGLMPDENALARELERQEAVGAARARRRARENDLQPGDDYLSRLGFNDAENT